MHPALEKIVKLLARQAVKEHLQTQPGKPQEAQVRKHRKDRKQAAEIERKREAEGDL